MLYDELYFVLLSSFGLFITFSGFETRNSIFFWWNFLKFLSKFFFN